MTNLLRSLLALLMLSSSGLATADLATATAAMESATNPLMLMRTSRGDIYLELFPQAAPRNVANFIALAEARVPLFDIATTSTVTPYYYDGLTFHRILRNYLVQAGAPRAPNAPVPEYLVEDEINARQFGLHEQKVLDPFGKPHPWLNLADNADFQRDQKYKETQRMERENQKNVNMAAAGFGVEQAARNADFQRDQQWKETKRQEKEKNTQFDMARSLFGSGGPAPSAAYDEDEDEAAIDDVAAQLGDVGVDDEPGYYEENEAEEEYEEEED